jgi:oxalate decarboxylase/phosphoglucose isomerase-like protein (cupin superfamily)
MQDDLYKEYMLAFPDRGFVGPVRLMSPETAQTLGQQLLAVSDQCPIWEKALATVDAEALRAAANPELLRIMQALIGDDVILWGASIVMRRPGDIHPWHCDIESAGLSGFVSAWIGLINIGPQSSLKLVPGSHRGATLQELAARDGISRGMRTDEAILRLAGSQDGKPEIVRAAPGDGEAILFDGRLWHGSENPGGTQRLSLLLQYARADIPVRIPDYQDFEWPFRFRDDVRPPVIAISGAADSSANHVVPAPTAIIERDVRPSAYRIDPNLSCRDGVAYESVPCFCGRTGSVEFMECHYTVLMPGHSPHLPHAHVDEEILVVMNGQAELVVPKSNRDETPDIFSASVGSAIYYPSYQAHTIRNVSEAPVSYAMIKWRSMAAPAGTKLNPQFLKASWVENERPRGRVAMTGIYEGATGFLAKLHAHISRIKPGAGYTAHRDDHDVAIFLIRGEIAIMGKKIIAPTIVFLPARSLHDLQSVGPDTAKYLVWEFHRTVEGLAPSALLIDAAARSGAALPGGN